MFSRNLAIVVISRPSLPYTLLSQDQVKHAQFEAGGDRGHGKSEDSKRMDAGNHWALVWLEWYGGSTGG